MNSQKVFFSVFVFRFLLISYIRFRYKALPHQEDFSSKIIQTVSQIVHNFSHLHKPKIVPGVTPAQNPAQTFVVLRHKTQLNDWSSKNSILSRIVLSRHSLSKSVSVIAPLCLKWSRDLIIECE